MKFISVLRKSLKEQMRSVGMLTLTVLSAPFFVFVYYLIDQSSAMSYEIAAFSPGISAGGASGIADSALLVSAIGKSQEGGPEIRLSFVASRDEGMKRIKNQEADLLLVMDGGLAEKLTEKSGGMEKIKIEFVGDLTSQKYMAAAIWVGEAIKNAIFSYKKISLPYDFKETSAGVSGNRTSFELYVPGLLVFAVIMIILNAAAVIVAENERKTIRRLRISKVGVVQFLSGVCTVQLFVAALSIALTLASAMLMGFRFEGSFILVLIILALASVSVIAFGLIVAAFSKSVNQVLVIGNFPLFIFMFFSGSMFPMNLEPLFAAGSYNIALNGILSPAHAVSALNKVMIMQEGLSGILPELAAIAILSIIYFAIGAYAFKKKRLSAE